MLTIHIRHERGARLLDIDNTGPPSDCSHRQVARSASSQRPNAQPLGFPMLNPVTVSDQAAAPLTTTQYTPPPDPGAHRRTKTAAFFDLDKTVIAKSS